MLSRMKIQISTAKFSKREDLKNNLSAYCLLVKKEDRKAKP